MRAGKVPGAVFVVMLGDRVLFQPAYGLADVPTRRPVSARGTLFRVASISKILTAAAVLQLAEAHRLDMHRNVNRYLTRSRSGAAFGQPITLFDLLTHSSGFDVSWLNYAARSAAGRLSSRDFLIRHQPDRVRPPGQFSGYDNCGYTLAGYLVQKVSGVPFSEYMRQRLLEPLAMDRSRFSPGPALRKRLRSLTLRLHYTLIPAALLLLFCLFYRQHLLFLD